MEIGAQLYTVREFCQTPDGIYETLKKVADIGYKTVQVSGMCEYDPVQLAEKLRENGLKCVLTHIPPARITDDTSQVIAEHDTLCCEKIGIGWYEVHKDGVEAFYERFAAASRTLRDSRKRLCYHNHDQEFIKLSGKTVLELLAERFEPDELCFTLDTYWVQRGGGDPAQWVSRLKGRVPCVHLKDMAYGGKMAALGVGNINLDGVISACADAGTQYLLVEQDDCGGQDPFYCLKTSYDYLRARGL